jgi:prolyl-tRNA synthetase
VPVRLEVGPKDVEKKETRCVRRDNGEISQLSLSDIGPEITKLLVTIQDDMLERATKIRDSRLVRLEVWDKFVETLNKKCLILSPWCEKVECEESVKDRSARAYLKLISEEGGDVDEKAPSMGAKTLCIPFKQPVDGVKEDTKCFACGDKAKSYTLWGRSY